MSGDIWDSHGYYNLPIAAQTQRIDGCLGEFAGMTAPGEERTKKAWRLSAITRAMKFTLGHPAHVRPEDVQAVLARFDMAVSIGDIVEGGRTDPFRNIAHRAECIREYVACVLERAARREK
ncbi:TPA: hypothetical protein DCL30_01065 [Candidatus Peribacteria bacterium]|nr:MAG: hypothetical protein A2529_01625 [Candidatus Peribacteria bacterium RIFOXYD2_FULL_58_15]HAI98118.1 hypothetical protein [Candidatus Peribacteria bacterium]HAS33841.1 hypothetical protein [Candidatus Peribacteria bacterium]